MSNKQSQKMNDDSKGGEFSRHWLLVLVCAVGIGVGVSALPFYTQGIFIEAWIADFGWTRAQASLGILGSTVALAAVLPFIGLIVDRYGLVKPVMISLLGLSVAYVLMGMFVQSIATFIALAMLQAVLGSASSPLAYTRAINTVFNKQRGLALGIALSGAGVAKNAPNRENAVKFLEYLASNQAQKYFSAGNDEYPAVAGVGLSDSVAKLGLFKADDVDLSAVAKNLPAAHKIFAIADWQ